MIVSTSLPIVVRPTSAQTERDGGVEPAEHVVLGARILDHQPRERLERRHLPRTQAGVALLPTQVRAGVGVRAGMPGGEQVEQLFLGIEAVGIVLGGEVLQRWRGLRWGVGRRQRGECGRSNREQARGLKILSLAGRGDEGRHQPSARGGRLARVAAEFEVLVGQLGEIQSFQIATEEGEVLQADPALGGGIAGSSRNATSSTFGSSAVVMGGFEGIRKLCCLIRVM
ncbi:hypothetical protein [Burkholderia diffusa]|uniref:hypothetical protein n=1 Tax=Burkholderia diffusa TaxID=488732 RepID=UPI000AE8DAED|nr:hypothetical protein [Burkholderia diffusa]